MIPAGTMISKHIWWAKEKKKKESTCFTFPSRFGRECQALLWRQNEMLDAHKPLCLCQKDAYNPLHKNPYTAYIFHSKRIFSLTLKTAHTHIVGAPFGISTACAQVTHTHIPCYLCKWVLLQMAAHTARSSTWMRKSHPLNSKRPEKRSTTILEKIM